MAPARTRNDVRGAGFGAGNIPNNTETIREMGEDFASTISSSRLGGHRGSVRKYRFDQGVSSPSSSLATAESVIVVSAQDASFPTGGVPPYFGGPSGSNNEAFENEGSSRTMPTGTVRGNGNHTPILAGNDRVNVNRFHGRTISGGPPAVAPNSSRGEVVSSSGTTATSSTTSPLPTQPAFTTPECSRRKANSNPSSNASTTSIQPNTTTVAAASFLELTAAAAAAAFTYDLGLGTFRHPGAGIGGSNNGSAISVSSSHHNPVTNPASLHPGTHHHVAVNPHHPSLHHGPFPIHPTSYFGTGTPQDENYNPLAACWSDIQTNNPATHPQAAAFVGYHHHHRGSASSRLEGSVGLGCAGVGEFSPFSHHLAAAAASGSTAAAHCASLTNGSAGPRSVVSDMAVQRFCQQIRGANTNGAANNANGNNANNNASSHATNVSPGLHTVPSLYHLNSHSHHHSTTTLNNAGRQSVNGHHNSHNGHHHHKSKPRRRVATLAQRRAANIRERRRMYNLNSAFDKLRKKVPTFAYEKRLSRIETLRLAIMYIAFMTEVIQASSVPGGGRGNNGSNNRSSTTCGGGEMHVGRSSCNYDNGNVRDLSDANNSALIQQPLLMTSSSNRSPSSYGSTIHEDSTWDSPLGSDSSPDTCPSPQPNDNAMLLPPETSLCAQTLRVFSSRRI